jgi:hypothetical protein
MYVINFNTLYATEETYRVEADVSSEQIRHISDTIQSWVKYSELLQLGSNWKARYKIHYRWMDYI